MASGLSGCLGCDEKAKWAETRATDVAAYGSNILLVLPGTGPVNFGKSFVSTLTIQDVDDIAKRCLAVTAAAPKIGTTGEVVFKGRKWRTQSITGTSRSYLTVRDWTELKEGAAFSEGDVRDGTAVCLLGQTVVDNLFEGDSPIGQQISIKGHSFRVVGILMKKGRNSLWSDQDDVVLVPWRAVGKLLEVTSRGEDNVDLIWVKAASTEKMRVAMKEITELLRERHHITRPQPDDFNFRDITGSMEKSPWQARS